MGNLIIIFIRMKYTIACALAIATVSTIKIGQKDIDMDAAKDAAYYPDHNTGNYTYSIKPNEYTSWNGISYTHNYDSTGKYGGANRIPVHDYPLFDNGVEKQQQTIDAHPKTEYGSGGLHTAVPTPCTTCWQ